MKQSRGLSACRAAPRILAALFFGALLAACAPLTYNRYQPAQTMGQGQFKLAASCEFVEAAQLDVMNDVAQQMENKMNAWADNHPNDVLAQGGARTQGSYVGPPFPPPHGNISLAYGAASNVDVEVSFSTDLYGRANAKVQLLRFGSNGALAFSPGIGFFDYPQKDPHNGGPPGTHDKESGFVGTVEAPLTVGWQYDHVAPYLGLMPVYNRIQFKIERTVVHSAFDGVLWDDFDCFSVGPVVGAQFKWSWFILTPEVVMLYTHVNGRFGVLPAINVMPGLQLGGQF